MPMITIDDKFTRFADSEKKEIARCSRRGYVAVRMKDLKFQISRVMSLGTGNHIIRHRDGKLIALQPGDTIEWTDDPRLDASSSEEIVCTDPANETVSAKTRAVVGLLFEASRLAEQADALLQGIESLHPQRCEVERILGRIQRGGRDIIEKYRSVYMADFLAKAAAENVVQQRMVKGIHQVEEFNKFHPVGSKVTVYQGAKGKSQKVKVLKPARIGKDGSAVVSLSNAPRRAYPVDEILGAGVNKADEIDTQE